MTASFHPLLSRNSPHFTPNFANFSPSSNELIQQLRQHQRPHQYPKLPTNQTIAMAPKGKKVERKEENISLGPQIREGQCTISFPMKLSPRGINGTRRGGGELVMANFMSFFARKQVNLSSVSPVSSLLSMTLSSTLPISGVSQPINHEF